MQIILNQEKENTSSLKMNGSRKSKINPIKSNGAESIDLRHINVFLHK